MPYFGETQEPLSGNRIASDLLWSWAATLGAARPGARYRVTDLAFSHVRDHCREVGIAEGDEIRLLGKQRWALELQRSDGCRVFLEHDYAWFVQVEPLGPSDAALGGTGSTS